MCSDLGHKSGVRRLLAVGNPAPFHVGAHIQYAGESLGLAVELVDSTGAHRAPWLWKKINWHLGGHRPARLSAFDRVVVEACRRFEPDDLLVTGITAPSARALDEIGRLGVRRLNFLTDDPWNRAHRAPWFMRALLHYDEVFSPRLANLDDLRRHGCGIVTYMPFAFSPVAHYPEAPPAAEATEYDADIMFAGGADQDRLPLVHALIDAGLRVALYGGYWSRDPRCRPFARGVASLPVLRRATGRAALCLCVVRRANRDGHCMRTFEVPAMHGCMLSEDTAEHRAILGAEGETTVYFRSAAELVERAAALVQDAETRRRLARQVRDRVVNGRHTYADRLAAMLGVPATHVVRGQTCPR